MLGHQHGDINLLVSSPTQLEQDLVETTSPKFAGAPGWLGGLSLLVAVFNNDPFESRGHHLWLAM